MRNKKTTLFHSIISLLLCVSMLLGTTFAWFTDSVQTGINTIAAGTLDVELYHSNAAVKDEQVDSNTKLFMDLQGDPILWEPGVVSYENLRIANEGDLALAYQLAINTENENYIVDPSGAQYGLSQALKVGVVEGGITATDRAGVVASVEDVNWTTLADFLRSGSLLPEGEGEPEKIWGIVVYWEPGENDNRWNLNNGKYLNEGEVLQIDLGVKLVATQEVFESDSFGDDYDTEAKRFVFPEFEGTSGSATVIPNDQNENSALVTIDAGTVIATVPAGVKLAAGVNKLTVTVSNMDKSNANITVGENEDTLSLDVHIEGVAEDNIVPITVELKEAASKGLNMGNYQVYHVENQVTNEMTLVDTSAEFTAHNQFKYDPVTGDVVLYMATFSEVALVADTENAWNGDFNYDWYTNAVATADGESTTAYIIANADQLAGFGAIVGGMDGKTADSFKGKTVKLISDINIGDGEEENNPKLIFYPIGYYNDEGTYERSEKAITSGLRNFEGIFDGQGHTVSNIYQNTWEMKGDNNYYNAALQYYRDGMGLFGRVYGATIKNLTVTNFKSDGEYTTTGCIAAYADGTTFSNIAITNCNPRVYNIGNGGIVGCVGWYAKDANMKSTFTNITVDNSNKISALWGSYDVACGGIVGQYYPTSGQSAANYPVNAGIHLENCHVAAQLDVYNDVCGNYQYYAYRYAGMLIGSIRENETNDDGKTIPKMDKITAENCTVNYGNWNGYYYCELQANGKASYTHDHKMSRLTQIDAEPNLTDMTVKIKGETVEIPKTGRANYVWVNGTPDTENAKCYHFVDRKVHNHDDYNGDGIEDKETVNGESIYVENNRHIYLPFYQLFTGYGWGVSSIGLKEYSGIVTDLGIKEDNYQGSDEKFVYIGATEYAEGKTINIGALFKGKSQSIKDNQVQVFVSPADKDSTVTANYVPASDGKDWSEGTLTFSGKGKATITITDYYFCTPTTITVNVTARSAEEKFDIVMNNGDFLHRVGNVGTVALNKLFKAKEGATIGNVAVTIEAVNGTVASGIYTPNSTWYNGTIQFNNTGVVKVTVTDNEYCIPTMLYLEVVDATNITAKMDATDKDVVLLNNISGGFTVSNGYSFYGNGFTVRCSGDGSYRSAAVSYGFITVEKGGVLDNVRVICDIFPESYAYTTEMKAGSDGRYPYGYSAVVVNDNSTISNCYIEGARNNIQVGEGNVTIENTSTAFGSLSNIHIKSNASYTVTLRNVTTRQEIKTSEYDTSKKVYGFGILVGEKDSESNAKLKLEGTLTQYNWIAKTDANSVSNTYAKTAITSAFDYIDYKNSEEKINTGIVYLNGLDAEITDDRTNQNTVKYRLSDVTISGYTGQVYSITSGSSGEGNNTAGNEDIRPTAVFVGTEQNVICSTEYNAEKGTWVSKLIVDLDKIDGGSYKFKFADLKVQKYGVDLAYSVTDVAGNAVVNKEISLNQLSSSEYILVVIDDQIYNKDGEKTNESVTRKIPFVLFATKTSIDPPKFANAETATAIRLVDRKGGDWRPAYTVLTGVTVTYWSARENKVKTVDLSTLYNSGTISSNVWTYTCDDFTLTITGGQVHSDGTKITPVVSNNTLYFASTNKTFTTGTTSRDIILTYVFTDKNASTTWNRTEKVTYSNLSEYSYSEFKKGTLAAPSSGSSPCVTADTLVTLADGTLKRIDEISSDDKLLVWNFFEGKYDVAPVAIIFDHGADNNTIIKLTFEDGTIVKVVNMHQFYDADQNRLVTITKDTVADYIGHHFAQYNGNGNSFVKLVNYEISDGYVEAWGVMTAEHYNIITAGMISADFDQKDVELFNYFEIGQDMKFDAFKMQADIDRYGLYTYEDFADNLTYEQFVAFNVQYFQIPVGKGVYTYEGILALIDTYLNN